MADNRRRRLAALCERLPQLHLDAFLVCSLPNVRYLTGFSGSNALLLVTQRESLLLTDFRYQTQAADEVGDVSRVRIEPASLWNGLWTDLAVAAGVETIGFESAHLFHRDFERLLDRGANWTWRATTDVVETLREQKDDDEVQAIREAAVMATNALTRTLHEVRPGLTELEVAGLLEQRLREAGSESHPFPAIVAAGPRTALPHARASLRTIAPGDLLLLDFGATTNGYCCDITRTVVVGQASDRQRELHLAVQEANERARRDMRAGMRGREADALAREVLERHGLGDAFGHGLGHGIGLEVHEAPRLSRIADAALPVGAVVTVEPGAYIPGWGGVRIEDDVHLNTNGTELLTHFERGLLEIS